MNFEKQLFILISSNRDGFMAGIIDRKNRRIKFVFQPTKLPSSVAVLNTTND